MNRLFRCVAPLLLTVSLLKGRLFNGQSGQQLAGVVIHSNRFVVRVVPHVQQLFARLDTVVTQQLSFAFQNGVQMRIARP